MENAAFAIPPMSDKKVTAEYGGGMSSKGLYSFLKDFLSSKNANVAELEQPDLRSFVTYLNENAHTILCPHYFEGIYNVENARIFKVVYGIPNNDGKDQFSFAQNFVVDSIFTFGEESVARFEKRNLPAVAVGNPLFDGWFGNEIDEDSLSLIKSKLKEDVPTILYLPTHNYYSSIDLFSDSIINLNKKYNVIVKLHHMTFNGEANRLCKFVAHPEIITLGDFFDPLPLYKVADVVLTDVSGAIFDAVLLEKPVIMLGNSLRKYRVDVLNPENSTASIEESGIIPYTEKPNEVEELIKRTIGQSIQIDEDALSKLFYKRDGLAGKRIANAILDEERFPLVSIDQKYDKAINKAPNEHIRQELECKREYFINAYTEKSEQKTLPVQKLKRILSKYINNYIFV